MRKYTILLSCPSCISLSVVLFSPIGKGRALAEKGQVSELANQRIGKSANREDGGWTLPDGWLWAALGECAQVITGTTPSKKDTSNYGDYLPLVKPPQLNDGVVRDAEDKLSITGAELARILPPQSVLVSCIGILGKTGINSVPVAFNQQINAVLFPPEILPRYGFYYFQTAEVKRWLHSVASATTVTIVNKSKFQRTPIPLAPLPEQRRIVAEIETQFTRLDAGVAALERAQANLRRYRAAVLKAACEGRLVPTEAELARAEGREYELADQLLDRILAERRAKWEAEHPGKKYKEPAPPDTEDLPELPEGWVWASVEQVSDRIVDCLHSTPKFQESGFLCVDTNCINPGKIVLEKARYVDEATFIERNRRMKPEEDDVLFSREGALLGIAARVPANLDICLGQRMMVFRLGEGIEAKHYESVLNSLIFRRQYTRQITGTASPHLNIRDIRLFAIPVPPVTEQRRIVAEVERRLSVVAALERAVEAALARARRLRRAVLKQAFEGRLVDQDPDDEPAAALLERIRAAREARATGGKKRKTRQMQLPTM